jgi:hypothetical protein
MRFALPRRRRRQTRSETIGTPFLRAVLRENGLRLLSKRD